MNDDLISLRDRLPSLFASHEHRELLVQSSDYFANTGFGKSLGVGLGSYETPVDEQSLTPECPNYTSS